MLKRVLSPKSNAANFHPVSFLHTQGLKVPRIPRAILITHLSTLQRTHREASVHTATFSSCRSLCVHTATPRHTQMASGTHGLCSLWCLNPSIQSHLSCGVRVSSHTYQSISGWLSYLMLSQCHDGGCHAALFKGRQIKNVSYSV